MTLKDDSERSANECSMSSSSSVARKNSSSASSGGRSASSRGRSRAGQRSSDSSNNSSDDSQRHLRASRRPIVVKESPVPSATPRYNPSILDAKRPDVPPPPIGYMLNDDDDDGDDGLDSLWDFDSEDMQQTVNDRPSRGRGGRGAKSAPKSNANRSNERAGGRSNTSSSPKSESPKTESPKTEPKKDSKASSTKKTTGRGELNKNESNKSSSSLQEQGSNTGNGQGNRTAKDQKSSGEIAPKSRTGNRTENRNGCKSVADVPGTTVNESNSSVRNETAETTTRRGEKSEIKSVRSPGSKTPSAKRTEVSVTEDAKRQVEPTSTTVLGRPDSLARIPARIPARKAQIVNPLPTESNQTESNPAETNQTESYLTESRTGGNSPVPTEVKSKNSSERKQETPQARNLESETISIREQIKLKIKEELLSSIRQELQEEIRNELLQELGLRPASSGGTKPNPKFEPTDETIAVDFPGSCAVGVEISPCVDRITPDDRKNASDKGINNNVSDRSECDVEEFENLNRQKSGRFQRVTLAPVSPDEAISDEVLPTAGMNRAVPKADTPAQNPDVTNTETNPASVKSSARRVAAKKTSLRKTAPVDTGEQSLEAVTPAIPETAVVEAPAETINPEELEKKPSGKKSAVKKAAVKKTSAKKTSGKSAGSASADTLVANEEGPADYRDSEKGTDHAKVSSPSPETWSGNEFNTFGLKPEIMRALQEFDYHAPTPIQAGVIPLALTGKDIMGQAQTGTGKTAAFALPLIQQIEFDELIFAPRALILVPTRELAVQVRDEIQRLSKYTDLTTIALYGGAPLAKQMTQLSDGADIVVGTPGRVIDHINRKSLNLTHLVFAVLDEADRMLDIGFRQDIEKILRQCPDSRQTFLLSATIPPQVDRLARSYMKTPEVLDFSPKNLAVETIEQFYFSVEPEKKTALLKQLLERENPHQAIIFCRTKRRTEQLYKAVHRWYPDCEQMHGDLDQSKRMKVMQRFREGSVRFLIATDVVGRGIDVSGISHIINYDIPQFCDDYVHRVGRTGRMGHEGIAYSFVTAEEGIELTRIEMRINRLLKRDEIPGFVSFTPPVPSVIPAEGDKFHVDDVHLDEDKHAKPVYGQRVRKVRKAL